MPPATPVSPPLDTPLPDPTLPKSFPLEAPFTDASNPPIPPSAAVATAAAAASGAAAAPAAAVRSSQRPLIVRFGAMGDMVMMTTLVRALSSRYASQVDILSSGPWTVPLLANQPGVGTIHLLKNRSLPFFFSKEQRTLVEALKRRGPGPTWYGDTDDKCLPLLHRAGIGDDLICNARDLPLDDGEHLIEYWQRFARVSPSAGAAGSIKDIVDEAPRLLVPRQDLELLDQWLVARGLDARQLLLIQPGNKRTMRRGLRRRPSNTKWWPETRWASVVQSLAEMHPQAAILLLGVPQEHELNEEIIALAGVGNAVNLACDLPIRRLLALQSRASAMISVDTGPAHSAAAVGCPVLVLFGVADPVRISPRSATGSPIRYLSGHAGNGASILGISVEQVLRQWQDLPKRPVNC